MSNPLYLLFFPMIMACSGFESPSIQEKVQPKLNWKQDLNPILEAVSLSNGQPIPHGLQTPVVTEYGTWQLSIQYFEKSNVLYLAINDYLWLDSSMTTQSTVFSMTQMLTQNHAMVGGKFQINPTSGAITICTELVVLKTLPKEELIQTIERLLFLAKDNYPMLKAALAGQLY